MSLRDYNARPNSFTQFGGALHDMDQFPVFNKQHQSMMYRETKISGEMDRPISPRYGSRPSRTPVLTDDEVPGLTEIKDIRVHNNLLEEIFNVEDSIELDYFEVERQEANFGSYLSGYNSPTNMRLSADLKQDDYWPGNGYLVNQVRVQKLEEESASNAGRGKGLSVTRPGPCEPSSNELVAVASPTISSTCEGGPPSSVPGVISSVKSDSSAAVVVNDTASVHSTTNTAGIEFDVILPNEKAVAAAEQALLCYSEAPNKLVPASGHAGQVVGVRANIRPRPEGRSHRSVNGGPVSVQNVDISGNLAVPTSSSAGLTTNGDSTTASSSSTTSPSQLHISKRQRVIDCGSDLLAEVRETYEFVQGADLYAPSSHPTFANVDAAMPPSCPPVGVKAMPLPAMNFNFGQNDAGPVMFVGSPRVGERSTGSNVPYSVSPYVDGRSAASPNVIHQSCPDLASPGRQQVHDSGYYQRSVMPRPLIDETSASLSAPTTPSKRAGPWSAIGQHIRGPMSPSMAPQGQWRPNVPMYSNRPVSVAASSQENFMTNNGGNRFVHATNNMQSSPYRYQYNPEVQQFGRPQSPRIPPVENTRGFPPTVNHGRSQYADVPGTAYQATRQMQGIDRQGGVCQAEGIPLSQNAFLRSIVNEGSVFQSHPLFPLLRDIIIADMNFHTPSFPFALIANLPSDFSRLVQNYMHRNPQISSAVASDLRTQRVVMDALSYAHAALIGKIEARKMTENTAEFQPAVSVAAGIEDFCETFERSVKPVVDEYRAVRSAASGDGLKSHFSPLVNPSVSQSNLRLGPSLHSSSSELSIPPTCHAHSHRMTHDTQYMTHSLPSSPQKLRPLYHQHVGGSFTPDMMGTSFEKTNRSKVLPKEAVALMTEWLKQHQDNPYPNDDEKESLIASTRLTMNQINYWFTNARRRILPKWSLQRQMEEQDRKQLEKSQRPQPRDVIVL